MKRIYTYGHEQVQRNLTIGDIVENKKKGVKMTQVTAQNRAVSYTHLTLPTRDDV